MPLGISVLLSPFESVLMVPAIGGLWSGHVEERTTSEMICKSTSFGRLSRAGAEENFALSNGIGMLASLSWNFSIKWISPYRTLWCPEVAVSR
ncbi:hypothetical protein DFJ58DRAFT_788543 [Suillus subalutaceus]|uniref:uncharacterized protein n=1 Tax=Suillus subalutaceus TaxID=48586 RepID=UPI001B885287|nr:uncharacterized protein DFJ58DRAFT_788543 [Suillus subalutaceus]KAG1854179.1 hypothetical protein DFJ58DRAFT_788543 [Suillus subalutaceus]